MEWLENYIDFNTEKTNQAVINFEKDFCKLINIALYGKTMEKVCNRIKVEFIQKDDNDKTFIQQSKITFMIIISLSQIVIVTYSSKMKHLWINRFT